MPSLISVVKMLDKKYARRLEFKVFVIISSIFAVVCIHDATICLHKNPSSSYSSFCNTFGSNMTCHNNHRMRIDNLEFYKSEISTGNCNSNCGSNMAVLDVHGNDLQILINHIYKICSFRQSCYLGSQFYTPTSLDTDVWFIEISYTCIEEANFDGQARIVCNTNDSDVVQTSSTTPVTSTSPSFTVFITTEDYVDNLTTSEVPAKTSDGQESQDTGQMHSEEFPVVPVVIGIVGSLVGVVIVIIIFVFIRKRRKSDETNKTTDQHISAKFQGKSYPKKYFPTNPEFGETTGELGLDKGAAADGDCELNAEPYYGDRSNEEYPSFEGNTIELYANVYTGKDNDDKDPSFEDNINGVYTEPSIEDESDLYANVNTCKDNDNKDPSFEDNINGLYAEPSIEDESELYANVNTCKDNANKDPSFKDNINGLYTEPQLEDDSEQYAEVYKGKDSHEYISLSEGTEQNNCHEMVTESDAQIEAAKKHRIPKPSGNYSHITTGNANVNCLSSNSDTDNYNPITFNTKNQATVFIKRSQ